MAKRGRGGVKAKGKGMGAHRIPTHGARDGLADKSHNKRNQHHKMSGGLGPRGVSGSGDGGNHKGMYCVNPG